MNWFGFTGGTVAPSGHLFLIDDVHMWAPYASWQGQRGEVTLEPGWPMNWDTTAASKAGTDSTKVRHYGDARRNREQIQTHKHTHGVRKAPLVSVTVGRKEAEEGGREARQDDEIVEFSLRQLKKTQR